MSPHSFREQVKSGRRNFKGITLSDCNLAGLKSLLQKTLLLLLDAVDFHEADLSGANLTGVTLFKVNMTGANLQRATLNRARLLSVRMEATDLRQANFEMACIMDTDLNDANLWGAILPDGELYGATLTMRAAFVMLQTAEDGFLEST